MPRSSIATSRSLEGSIGYTPAASAAEVPGSGAVAHRAPEDSHGGSELRSRLLLALFAVALVAAWFAVDPRTPDLAGATYRVSLFKQLGFTIVDERWYAGHDIPGYSLLFPALGALLGLRLLGALAVLCSCLLFERLTRPLYGRAATWGTAAFTLAALGDLWSGRVAFALGVPFALSSLLCLRRGHPLLAALLAAACAAASPVAGALLGLAALTLALIERSPRALVVLAAPAAVVVLGLAALFPEGGHEPYPLLSFLASSAVAVLFLLALPRGPSARGLRLAGAVYLLACLGCLLVRTPMGSNIERYGALLAAPLLICALLAARRAAVAEAATPALRWSAARSRAPELAGAATLLAIAVWVAWGPVRETLAVAGSEATSASYYIPLERFLASRDALAERVEVPLTRSHWEAAQLAPYVALARGWEKQLEERYDGVLLSSRLTAAGYERWLHEQAVSYVALPDSQLDPSSAAEGRLVRAGLPFLQPVFASTHWRVYRVLGAAPILSGAAGTLLALGHDSFSLRASRPGSFLVRVHYTRYWAFTRGRGCITSAPGGWTRVSVASAGVAVIAARFSLSRALGSAGSCT